MMPSGLARRYARALLEVGNAHGSTAQLGQEMQAGAAAYFKFVNKRGGVHGRTLVLKTLDDGYEVDRTVANVKTLINEDRVFALFGGASDLSLVRRLAGTASTTHGEGSKL